MKNDCAEFIGMTVCISGSRTDLLHTREKKTDTGREKAGVSLIVPKEFARHLEPFDFLF